MRMPCRGESHVRCAKRKKPKHDAYVLYGSIQTMFWKEQGFRECNPISRCQGLGLGHEEFLTSVNTLCPDCGGG